VVDQSTLPRQFQIGETGRPLTSMFLKRGRKLEYVRAGSRFRKIHPDTMIETATVLSVATDSFGIPHVKFQVTFRRPNRNFFDGGARMLALKSFAKHYKERVAERPDERELFAA
jgi:hypothetical protein